MNGAVLLRLYALLFLLALAWVLLGAPLLPAEWQDVPNRLRLMLIQLPRRTSTILIHWR